MQQLIRSGTRRSRRRITFALFFVMQSLIAPGSGDEQAASGRRPSSSFASSARRRSPETRSRARSSGASIASRRRPSCRWPGRGRRRRRDQRRRRRRPPCTSTRTAPAEGHSLGAAPTDAEPCRSCACRPIIRCAPRIAGSRDGCTSVHDHHRTGRCGIMVVVRRRPAGLLRPGGLAAVQKYKYQPRIENGVPVEDRVGRGSSFEVPKE